jgi:hypothetical protein
MCIYFNTNVIIKINNKIFDILFFDIYLISCLEQNMIYLCQTTTSVRNNFCTKYYHHLILRMEQNSGGRYTRIILLYSERL